MSGAQAGVLTWPGGGRFEGEHREGLPVRGRLELPDGRKLDVECREVEPEPPGLAITPETVLVPGPRALEAAGKGGAGNADT